MNMNEWYSNPGAWDNYDSHPFPTMNPMLGDMAMLNDTLISQSHPILLLTLEEAQEVTDEMLGNIDSFFSYRAGPGNIKDAMDGFHFLSRLTTYYNPAGQLLINFKSLGIKAVEYTLNGHSYIKITGYPGLRRILQGTRYGARNVQIMEMGIGRLGYFGAITGGIKCCIYFSLAWRAIELIFKSDYTLNDFLVDIPMDAVKAMVAGVVIGAIGGGFMLISGSILITPFCIIAIGFATNIGFNIIDDKLNLSASLKKGLLTAITERNKISAWNLQHNDQFFSNSFSQGW